VKTYPGRAGGQWRTAESARASRCGGRVADQLERARLRRRARYPGSTRGLPGEIDIGANGSGVNRHNRAPAALAGARSASRLSCAAERGSGDLCWKPARLRYPIRSRTRLFSEIVRRRRPRAPGAASCAAPSRKPSPRSARRLALCAAHGGDPPRHSAQRRSRAGLRRDRPGCRPTARRMPGRILPANPLAHAPRLARIGDRGTFARPEHVDFSRHRRGRRLPRGCALAPGRPADRGGQHRRHRGRTSRS